MQDLAGLHVGGSVLTLALMRGEKAQHAACQRRLDPQHLERGEQTVAAEWRREPRHAGVGVSALRRLGEQHREVGARAFQHAVEQGVGGLDRRRGGARRGERTPGYAPHDEEAPLGRGRRLAFDTLHRQRDRPALAGGEIELELGAALGGVGREARRPRREREPRTARHAVERGVVEAHLVRALDACAHRAAARASVAADLEEIREIGGEVERQVQAALRLAVARHREKLVAGGLPQELGARDMERVLGEHQAAFGVEEIRVRQVDIQHHVVGLHGRGEHHRPVPLEREAQAREKARVVVEEAGRAVLDLEDVAELIEHGKARAVLERAPARGGERHHPRHEHRRDELGIALHTAATARRRPSAR